jgi:hypothetical protein
MNRDEKGVADLDMALAPPEEKERLVDRQNAQAMQRLMGTQGLPMPPRPQPGRRG